MLKEATCLYGWWRFIVFEREGNDVKKLLVVAVLCFFVLLCRGFSAEAREVNADNLFKIGANASNSTHAITILFTALWCSQDPKDLDPLIGTTWSFSFCT